MRKTGRRGGEQEESRADGFLEEGSRDQGSIHKSLLSRSPLPLPLSLGS